MAFTKLNHVRVQEEMRKALLRPIELAKRLETNRQTVNYLLYVGGLKYAQRLANVFGCKREDLIIDTNPS